MVQLPFRVIVVPEVVKVQVVAARAVRESAAVKQRAAKRVKNFFMGGLISFPSLGV